MDEKVLLRVLAKQGEHERLMKYLLDKARPGARQTRMDPDEIQELVETAVNDESLDNAPQGGRPPRRRPVRSRSRTSSRTWGARTRPWW